MTATTNADLSKTPLLELKSIRKVYQSLVANDGVNLTVMPNEIHAVLGENGAGKSTMMKMIYGVTHPTSGDIFWRGKKVAIRTPAEARALGIGMVFQHFSLFETLSVVENVALGLDNAPSLRELAIKIREVSEKYGLPVDPQRSVHALSVGEMQRVEIIRCLLQSPQLLIMDEPTSVLSPAAVRTLFETLRQLAQEGCSILYISHKLDEIQALCHTATVLRAGVVTGTCTPSQETPKSMARLMIGNDLPVTHHGLSTPHEVRLRLAGVSHESADPFGVDLKDIHLEVRAGEVIGIAGISGNGQKELLSVISGEELLAEKHPVQIMGLEVGRMSARERRGLGLCFVPEERLGRGAVPPMSLADNALLTMLSPSPIQSGMIRFGVVDDYAKACIEKFKVKTPSAQAPAQSLSGGNLQKFIVGREMMQSPTLLVLAQPTWGVDVGAAGFIRQRIIELREAGTAVLVISEEMDELFEVADRIAVIAKGKMSPTKAIADTSIEEIGVWMSGLWSSEESPTESTIPKETFHA